MILKKIKILRKKFKQYDIDGYIIPKNDEYFSEYAKNDRLKNIRLMDILFLKMMIIFLSMQKMIG